VGPHRSPSSYEQAESTRLRLAFLSLVVVSLFVLLLARLWFLQVMVGERYSDLAQGNAVRTIVLEAPRGKVLDRDGDTLVRNRFALVVSVRPEEMGERKGAVLADLADLLGMAPGEMTRRIEEAVVSPFRPKPVAVDVPEDIVFYINENAATRYPGVYAETLPVRDYPQGALAAHLVGFLGEISAEELADERYAGYRPGELIGEAGVERSYQDVLRGVAGERRLEVNARGEVVGVLEEVLPQPGADVQLTIDVDVQRLAEQALAEGIATARGTADRDTGPDRGGTFAAPAGAVVAMDPRDGSIRALASFPSYDPARFVGGVSHEYWSYLQEETNSFPLLNRAVQSSYPPGSVFKVVPAAAALTHGYLEIGQELACPGSWEWNGSVYRNWKRSASRPMNIAESLVHSCDTVYYELARRMWIDEQAGRAQGEIIPDQARAWGFGAPTGVDLPGERAGVIPDRAWKADTWQASRERNCAQARTAAPGSYAQQLFTELCSEVGSSWRGGDAVNMSIGQGDVQTTPLQVARAFAAIANGGTLYAPHVGGSIRHPDGTVGPVAAEVAGTLPVSATHLAYIQQGLHGVTARGGTAGSVFGSFPLAVAGKTGTAEIGTKQPFAWFAGYNTTPVDGEQLVVVAVVEEGGGGSQTAAPIVRRIFEGVFGLQPTPIAPGAVTD